MQKVLTADEMREVDRLTAEKYGIPSIILMENAAHAAARIVTEKLGGSVTGKSFLIICGKGNNGGDGAALARILWSLGASVWIYLFGEVKETKGDAKINFQIIEKLSLSCSALKTNGSLFFKETKQVKDLDFTGYDVVIDALFGTGLDKPVQGNVKDFISLFRAFKFHIKKPLMICLDMPSGLSADYSDKIGENTDADLTITFTAAKPANILPPASNSNGEIIVVNIGSPPELIENTSSKLFVSEKKDAQEWIQKTAFANDSYKNKRGHAFLVVGSKDYTGAAVLAGNAAMCSGVGLTTIATSKSAQKIVAAKISEEVICRSLPENDNGTISTEAFAEIMNLAEKSDVIGIGCGLGNLNSDSGIQGSRFKIQKTKLRNQHSILIKRIIEAGKQPVIIDADGLNMLAPFNLQVSDESSIILTPHEGEFLRLLGSDNKQILQDRVKSVRDFAQNNKVILVLKGERVLIGAPDGRVVVNPTGNSGLGKAGNGDTLTGIITGFVAQAMQLKVDIFETVVAAVYIAGMAGDIAARKYDKRTMLASDVRNCLSEAFAEIQA